ncbi:unnamed protein product, partial [Dibothriocephalus latus]
NGNQYYFLTPLFFPTVYALSSANQRFCCRCGHFYAVNKFGEAVTTQTCIYHWGKPINRRVPGGFRDMRYTCCQAEVGAQGCQVGTNGHVSDINKWCDLDGYVSALPALPQPADSPPKVNVYALDCEMVYTTGGYGRLKSNSSYFGLALRDFLNSKKTKIEIV